MYRNIKRITHSFREKLAGDRLYHSDKGVFGYRPRAKRDYKLAEDTLSARTKQSNVYRLIDAYRKYGHRLATVDSVKFKENLPDIQELKPEFYGLKATDIFTSEGILNVPTTSGAISELQQILHHIYCGPVSAEISHIEELEEREWLSTNFEQLSYKSIPGTVKREIAQLLIKSQAWDNFLATKFPTVKRYGGEGAESMMAFFREIFELSVEDKLEHIVLGMPHRGRGNLLTTMLNTRPAKFFKKFQGGSEFPSEVKVYGDVVSHFSAAEELKIKDKKIRISMLRNPSHLEAVNPVSMGKTRSKQQTLKDGPFGDDPSKDLSSKVLNIQLHGDAAFAGQGINQECLMMANVPHFDVGGTIHMIVNNQVGFTTPGDRGRGTNYSSDLAKSINAPIFHVNGDDPELLALVTKLAFDYQRKFRKDVFIDLNCFRRWGHNELDDPTFTNPALYSIIHSRKSVPDLYAEKLISEDIITKEEVETVKNNFMEFLNEELSLTSSFEPEPSYFQRQWTGLQLAPNAITYWDTGVDYSVLHYIGKTSVYYPRDFNIHPHLLKMHVEARLRRLNEGQKIDWATAEALAIGSLMYQGNSVRLSGEDVGRGTFSHRHAMLIDQKTNDMFIPLNTLSGGMGGTLEIANSILSEEAGLGYEYGMAIDNPNNLIIWEAQFGDFFNGAQIIIDTFIASGETKWMESNGLVMLLPHGYDGAASEHSSCRMERFLQLTDSKENAPDGDDVNLHIINPSTPAQYFHALRRQMLRNFRKPLIVVAPKILLRLSDAASPHTEMQPGTYFKNVLGDQIADPNKVKKVIICSGKHYYALNAERNAKGIDDVGIIRIESLCPFPLSELQDELGKYKNSRAFVWSQEEARNMGAWSFIRPRFEYLIGKPLKYCGRAEAPTPATGDGRVHRKEIEEIIANPFII